jgi:hypothetical protein
MDKDELDSMMDHTRFDEVDEHTARLARKTVEMMKEALECNEPSEYSNIAHENTQGFAECIAKIAEKATSTAAEESLAMGIPICIIEGDYIVIKYPDGHTERIKEAPESVKVEKRVYYI